MELQKLESLESKANEFEIMASLLPEIENNIHLEKTNEFLKAVKTMKKEVANTFDPIISKAHAAHKEAVAQKNRFIAPLTVAELIAKNKVGKYLQEQEKIRLEAVEKARKAEEEARKKLEEEELARFKKAKEAEKNGNIEEAEQIWNEKKEIVIETPIVPEKISLEGTSIRKIWKWKVVDINQVLREYLMVDSAKITNLVKANRDTISIPGIEIYSEDSVAIRG